MKEIRKYIHTLINYINFLMKYINIFLLKLNKLIIYMVKNVSENKKSVYLPCFSLCLFRMYIRYNHKKIVL